MKSHNVGGVLNKLKKEVIMGLLTILVLLATVQGIRPVLADGDSGDAGPNYFHTFVVSVSGGQGTVCWSGENVFAGCTQVTGFVSVKDTTVITFTATGAGSYRFASWNLVALNEMMPNAITLNSFTITTPAPTTSSMNPYTITTPYGNGEYFYITANFK